MVWRVFVYRKLSKVDVQAHQEGDKGLKRFEILSGPPEAMQQTYQDFARDPQVLAVEMIDEAGVVVDRQDSLVELTELLTHRGKDPLSRIAWTMRVADALWNAVMARDVADLSNQ